MSRLSLLILALSTNFCSIEIDLSGNTLLPQAPSFSKSRQIGPFLAFLMNFCPIKLQT